MTEPKPASFYNDLLKKVLALPQVQAEIEDMRKDDEAKERTDFDYQEEALENFLLEGDNKDILAVPEIWKLVQETIRETTRDLTYNAKTFLEEISSLDAEEIYHKTLDDIREQLDQALKRKHGKEQK